MRIWLLRVCRVLLGLVFVFSGFVKAIDPWGTALKIGEYLSVYGMVWLAGWRIGLAVAFSAIELALGLMLVAGAKKRVAATLALVFMAGFTAVTLLSATVLPVGDCGCFGDALHLSPWVSVAKNVVLLAIAVVVWWFGRGEKKEICSIFERWRGWAWTAAFVCVGVVLGVVGYCHLPMIDILPFKKGVDLREAIYGENAWESDIRLREFALFNDGGDATREILEYPGRVYILVAADLDRIGNNKCHAKFGKIVVRASQEGAKVVLVTSTPLPLPEGYYNETFSLLTKCGVPAYNMGSSTMLTMLRAKTGMVVLENGVIVEKKNCRDIK